MNLVILTGRLTKDPECRFTQGGKECCTFTIAVDRGYGEHKKTDFINCVAWGKTGNAIGNNMSKGSKIIITNGVWATRNYDGQDGKKVYVNECIVNGFEFGDSKGSGGNHSDGSGAEQFGQSVSEGDIQF